jgi:mannitol/fructose-specific phosphotransferase system IIA component (Ntr-type)
MMAKTAPLKCWLSTAIDERPVDLVFLLLIPDQAGGDHLAALACVSRKLRDRAAAAKLRAAKTAAEMYEILTGPRPVAEKDRRSGG